MEYEPTSNDVDVLLAKDPDVGARFAPNPDVRALRVEAGRAREEQRNEKCR
jgi:hypothetical protein